MVINQALMVVKPKVYWQFDLGLDPVLWWLLQPNTTIPQLDKWSLWEGGRRCRGWTKEGWVRQNGLGEIEADQEMLQVLMSSCYQPHFCLALVLMGSVPCANSRACWINLGTLTSPSCSAVPPCKCDFSLNALGLLMMKTAAQTQSSLPETFHGIPTVVQGAKQVKH